MATGYWSEVGRQLNSVPQVRVPCPIHVAARLCTRSPASSPSGSFDMAPAIYFWA
jgi:hypothetical protein